MTRYLSLGLNLKAKELTRIAALVVVYVVASAIPFSTFVGGAGFITLGIVFVPVLAALLRPTAATIAGLVGALVSFVFQTATAPVFGFYSLLIPSSGVILGSLGFNKRYGFLAPWAYVLFGAAYYLTVSGGTVLWLAPYALVAVTLPVVMVKSSARTPLLCLYTTMSELVTMNIGSIAILNLPGQLWSIIAPVMFFERTVGTLGSYALIRSLRRVVPGSFGVAG